MFSFEPKYPWGSARIMWVQTRNWFEFKKYLEFKEKNILNQNTIDKNSLRFKKILEMKKSKKTNLIKSDQKVGFDQI